MNYGGSNDVINSQCPRCGKSPDTHTPFPFVSSGNVTASLLERLTAALKDNAVGLYLQGYRSAVTTSMMGAAVALIGTEKRQYLSLSGPGTVLLNHIDRRFIGNDVVLVGVDNGLDNLIMGAGGVVINSGEFPNNPYARKRDGSLPKAYRVPRPPLKNRNRDYPLGACAAIKLLTRIYKDAVELGQDIKSIELAELLWFDNTSGGQHNRDWSTGQIVMSCDTCKQVLPQILCSNI